MYMYDLLHLYQQICKIDTDTHLVHSLFTDLPTNVRTSLQCPAAALLLSCCTQINISVLDAYFKLKPDCLIAS